MRARAAMNASRRPAAAFWSAVCAICRQPARVVVTAGVVAGLALVLAAAGAKAAGNVPLPQPRPGHSGLWPAAKRLAAPAPLRPGAQAPSTGRTARPGSLCPGQRRLARRAVCQPRRPSSRWPGQSPVPSPSRRPPQPRTPIWPRSSASIDAAQKGKDGDADAAERTIADPVARKLAEWMILRSYNTQPNFQRYADFIKDNPDWPHVPLFTPPRREHAVERQCRRRHRARLLRTSISRSTAKGRYALARALLAKGDRAGAQALVQHAWRYQDAAEAVEKSRARTVRQPADQGRPQDPHGPAFL